MATMIDPVCGMELDSSQIGAQTIYKDQKFNFCSEDCRRIFEDDPEEFLKNAPAPADEPPPA